MTAINACTKNMSGFYFCSQFSVLLNLMVLLWVCVCMYLASKVAGEADSHDKQDRANNGSVCGHNTLVSFNYLLYMLKN